MTAYARTADGTWFEPTDHCRGPWDEHACHAGPPTGLLARGIERTLASGGLAHRLTRLTVELIRPVPMAGFAVSAAVDRAGRATATADAELRDGEGRLVASARGLAFVERSLGEVPTAEIGAPSFDASAPGTFPLGRTRHGHPSFLGSTEVRYPPGDGPDGGPTTVWMCALPLVEGEVPTPFQAICPLADCGNAISRNAEPDEMGFVNPDLTISLFRPPVGEWFAAAAVSHWEPSGIGVSDAALFDVHGPVGRAVQTLMLHPTD